MESNNKQDEKWSPLDIEYIPNEKRNSNVIPKKRIKDDYDSEAPNIPFLKLYKFSSNKDRIMIIFGILSAGLTGLTIPLNTLIFGDLIGSMVKYGLPGDSKDPNSFLESVKQFSINNSILGAIMFLFSYTAVTLFNYAAQNQIYRIRGLFFRAILNQDISWYDFNQSGEFASRINDDLNKLEEGLGEKVIMFTHFNIAFFASIILAFIKGWELALICLSSLPVTMISIGLVAFATSKLSKQESDVFAKAGSIAEEVISSIRTVFSFGGEEKELERYKESLKEARKINIKKGFFSGLGFGLLWFFIYASYSLSFWYGIGLVVKQRWWEDQNSIIYTPANMFTIFFSVMMGVMNLGMSSPYIQAFGNAKGAAAKIFQILKRIPKINPLLGKGLRPEEARGDITFENVSFEYPSRPEVKVLKDVSFSIKRGETVALVGSSGCGKSTCIQLIQRFYDICQGRILFDGIDIRDLDVNWLRSKIGVVGQEPVLFDCSIYENIEYGREDSTSIEIEKAAKEANAHQFIQILPEGYKTLVGSRGAQLSGGQKQRIAIARALIRNPEILLLDEATSALDTASEAKVQNALEKVSKGRTTIIVAHRLSTIRNADKIVVIDAGKVVEIGSHQELMTQKGYYYNLVALQLGKNNLAYTNKDEKNNTQFVEEENTEDIEILHEIPKKEEELIKGMSLIQVIKWNAKEWPHILVGCLTAAFVGCSLPLYVILLGDIFAILSSPDDDHVKSETNLYCLYFLLIGIAVGSSMFLQIFAFTHAGEKLTERLRGIMFKTILSQEIAWFDEKSNGTGSLCARLSAEAAAVQGATGQPIATILQSIATLVLGTIIAMYYEWKLGLLALVFCPFILIGTILQRKIMTEQNMGVTKALESSTNHAIEAISSVRTVVSLGRERLFYEKYIEMLLPAIKKAKITAHYRGIVYGFARSLMYFGFSATMYYGGYLVTHEGLFYPNVMKVSQALILGTMTVGNAIAFAPNFQKGLQSASNISKLLNRQPKIIDKSNAINDIKWQSENGVKFNDVEFSYPARQEIKILKQLNFTVKKGQSIALVGRSGCGKSTCIQLLERFYDVDMGKISIDSINIQSIALKTLRIQLGIVSQEPILFDRTIYENIAYGDNFREIKRSEVIAAAVKANIHNFITKLPLGYETRLGEKGTQLSGGQKQRIAIARALIRNPRILLLDEATSALDASSEKVVQEALDAAKEGRTCITIAHRLSTIIDSDIIFVLDNGRIVESGKHQELLLFGGIYSDLCKLQGGEK